MTTPTLSLIIPTAGRFSLRRTLESAAPQLLPGDEMLVIGDVRMGALPEMAAICADFPQCRYVPFTDGVMSWGHRQTNHGMTIATGDYLSFNDDDDVYTGDALALMRAAATDFPGRPLLFRFRSYLGGLEFWLRAGLVQQACIGGHCAVVPRDHRYLGRWGDHYEGDFQFIKESLDNWADAGIDPVWCPQIIAVQRPRAEEIAA